MPGDDRSRAELAQFLRNRRDRVSPPDVGLVDGPRRRASGLRRAEVAVLAGLSTSWYTNLEQGREVTPSRDVLDRLAQVLQMTEDERRYMYVLVHGSSDDYAEALTSRSAGTEMARDMVRLSDVSPYPVYACDEYLNLLAWNPACTEWYDDWDALPPDPLPNVLRWFLIAPEARERLVDWEEVTRDAVARWRSKCGRRTDDPQIERLNAEYHEMSPEFRQWWSEHEVLEHRTGHRTFRHPRLGRQTLHVVPVVSPAIAAHGIIYHVPVSSQHRPHQH